MSTPEQNPRPVDFGTRVEFFLRRVFERVGAAFDFALRRGSGLEGGPRTDLATLVAHLEQAIEAHLRREDGRLIAPNLIELRYDFETYTRMGAARREFLQHELTSNIYEYIYNRRYATLGPTQVRIAYDAFTRGLEVRAEFGEPKPAVLPQNEPAGASETAVKSCELVLRLEAGRRDLRARVRSGSEPAGVGRNTANALIINDPSVSNFHAAFLLAPDGNLLLADRGSSNGTAVNGVVLEEGGRSIVRNGDRLRFGDVEAALELVLAE